MESSTLKTQSSIQECELTLRATRSASRSFLDYRHTQNQLLSNVAGHQVNSKKDKYQNKAQIITLGLNISTQQADQPTAFLLGLTSMSSP